jgi:type I restriction enzyme S subunit
LPGFGGEWDNSRLDSLFLFKKGSGISKDKITNSGKAKCILYGELFTKYKEIVIEVISKTNSYEGIKSKIGDVLIPGSTTTSGVDLANATAILEDDIKLGGDIIILRPKKKINPIFISHLLTHIKKKEIASRAQGITIVHIYSNLIKDIEISYPKDLQEQNAISDALTMVDDLIQSFDCKLYTLKREKKALMQQLLGGH